MEPKSDNTFNFEYWRRLAAEDPVGFESARVRAVTALIESAPPESKRHLQGVQWRIDRLRERAPNPMAACLRLSGLMWESLLGKDGLLDTLKRLERLGVCSARPPAKIVPLRRSGSTRKRGQA
ncbi:MAG: DUF3135 domain-containing protein [Chromatiales bacterium]